MNNVDDVLNLIDDALGAMPGEASWKRFVFCLEQLSHAYTNMFVEYPRMLGGVMTKRANWFGREKDVAYVVGHIIQFIPAVPLIYWMWQVHF